MIKQRVYLAGGFGTNWQESVISELKDKFIFLNPKSHGLKDPIQYWAWDMHFVKESDIIFAYMDKNNPSGYGLALEVGVGFGLNKTILLIDERSGIDSNFESYFKIIHQCASVILPSLPDGINYLRHYSIY